MNVLPNFSTPFLELTVNGGKSPKCQTHLPGFPYPCDSVVLCCFVSHTVISLSNNPHSHPQYLVLVFLAKEMVKISQSTITESRTLPVIFFKSKLYWGLTYVQYNVPTHFWGCGFMSLDKCNHVTFVTIITMIKKFSSLQGIFLSHFPVSRSPPTHRVFWCQTTTDLSV